MMFLLEYFVLFPILAATGQSLQCANCFSLNSDSCTGIFSSVCPSGYVCASQYSVSVVGSLILQSFNRLCAPKAECSVTGSYTSQTGTFRIATTCCDTDNCTPATPRLPNTSSQPNGVWCQQCYSTDTYACTGGLVQCNGEQTMCLKKSEIRSTGSQTLYSSQRGCASKGYCNMRNTSSVSGAVQEETTYTCTNGAPNTATTAAFILFLFVIFNHL
ncbi:uncharacterized protein LOC143933597 [Lithobates pipiens]